MQLVTPTGLFQQTCCDDVVISADWVMDNADETTIQQDDYFQQLMNAYWASPSQAIPVKLLKQGSPYRQRVWSELCQIPSGSTVSYAILAKKIASSARAVGNACRDNPYPLYVPCHRVVSAKGFGGYCGYTDGSYLALKQKLLTLESISL